MGRDLQKAPGPSAAGVLLKCEFSTGMVSSANMPGVLLSCPGAFLVMGKLQH